MATAPEAASSNQTLLPSSNEKARTLENTGRLCSGTLAQDSAVAFLGRSLCGSDIPDNACMWIRMHDKTAWRLSTLVMHMECSHSLEPSCTMSR